jgi:hypothetical protein
MDLDGGAIHNEGRLKGNFFDFLKLYSTLLHLPPLRFTFATSALTVRRSYHGYTQ